MPVDDVDEDAGMVEEVLGALIRAIEELKRRLPPEALTTKLHELQALIPLDPARVRAILFPNDRDPMG